MISKEQEKWMKEQDHKAMFTQIDGAMVHKHAKARERLDKLCKQLAPIDRTDLFDIRDDLISESDIADTVIKLMNEKIKP
jgi:hypothetical protein